MSATATTSSNNSNNKAAQQHEQRKQRKHHGSFFLRRRQRRALKGGSGCGTVDSAGTGCCIQAYHHFLHSSVLVHRNASVLLLLIVVTAMMSIHRRMDAPLDVSFPSTISLSRQKQDLPSIWEDHTQQQQQQGSSNDTSLLSSTSSSLPLERQYLYQHQQQLQQQQQQRQQGVTKDDDEIDRQLIAFELPSGGNNAAAPSLQSSLSSTSLSSSSSATAMAATVSSKLTSALPQWSINNNNSSSSSNGSRPDSPPASATSHNRAYVATITNAASNSNSRNHMVQNIISNGYNNNNNSAPRPLSPSPPRLIREWTPPPTTTTTTTKSTTAAAMDGTGGLDHSNAGGGSSNTRPVATEGNIFGTQSLLSMAKAGSTTTWKTATALRARPTAQLEQQQQHQQPRRAAGGALSSFVSGAGASLLHTHQQPLPLNVSESSALSSSSSSLSSSLLLSRSSQSALTAAIAAAASGQSTLSSSKNQNSNTNNWTTTAATTTTTTSKNMTASAAASSVIAVAKQLSKLGIHVTRFVKWKSKHGGGGGGGGGTLLPCFPAEIDWRTSERQNAPANTGLLFVKPHKTGSSTMTGINLRIARNMALRGQMQNATTRIATTVQKGGNDGDRAGKASTKKKQKTSTVPTSNSIRLLDANVDYTICRARFDHGPLKKGGGAFEKFRHRVRAKSFLWTVVREPTSRFISQFFHFVVSRGKMEPTDANMKSFLRYYAKGGRHSYYLSQLHTKAVYHYQKHNPVDVINDILTSYDFIGVTERADESLVALQMILDLPMSDILYLNAKGRGGYDDGHGVPDRPDTCTYIWPSFVTNTMKQYLASTEWKQRIRYDSIMYQAANRALDLTIIGLGTVRFQKRLHEFQRVRQIVQEQCTGQARFPCNDAGEYSHPNTTDCLWNDSACGTPCLDDVATQLNLW